MAIDEIRSLPQLPRVTAVKYGITVSEVGEVYRVPVDSSGATAGNCEFSSAGSVFSRLLG